MSHETPTLKSIGKDPTFWVLLAMSVPGIIAAYLAAIHGVRTGDFRANDFYSAVFAAPIVVYLGIGRQYARGKVVEQVGQILVARETAAAVPYLNGEAHFDDGYAAGARDASEAHAPSPEQVSAELPLDGEAIAKAVAQASGFPVPASVAEAAAMEDPELPTPDEAVSTALAPVYDPYRPEVRNIIAERDDARGEQ